MLKWTLAAVAAVIVVFVDMDRMVGGMFDQGLAQMKSVVERRP
jgi:hypothetical protein